MPFCNSIIRDYTYLLPLLAALITVFTLPPHNWPGFVFIAFVFLLLAINQAASGKEAAFYGLLYKSMFSAFVLWNVLSGFHWFAGAEIFVWVMYCIGIGIFIFTTILSATIAYFIYQLKAHGLLVRILATSLLLLLGDVGFNFLLSGFNYGSIQFATALLPGSFWLLHFLPIEFLVFLIIIVNTTIVEAFVTKNKKLIIIPIVILSIFLINTSALIKTETPSTSTIKVSVIQSQERNPDVVFGQTVNGVFTAEHLTNLIKRANVDEPDVIIYPFNPWVGVMTDDNQETYFNKDIVAVRRNAFNLWVKKNVPQDVVFVTWYTTYHDNKYYNEIGYWLNGVPIGSYQKQELFPFFDYTPLWAQEFSIYSTPYDGSAGERISLPINTKGVLFGNLVCSEIINKKAVSRSAATAEILVAIGSEAMFSNELPAVYNYAQARLHAINHQIPVVRATKLGPSGIFDKNGRELGSLEYGENDILTVEIPI